MTSDAYAADLEYVWSDEQRTAITLLTNYQEISSSNFGTQGRVAGHLIASGHGLEHLVAPRRSIARQIIPSTVDKTHLEQGDKVVTSQAFWT